MGSEPYFGEINIFKFGADSIRVFTERFPRKEGGGGGGANLRKNGNNTVLSC